MSRLKQTSDRPNHPLEMFPTREVMYLGIPHQAKFVEGKWYFKGLDGNYSLFVFQNRVEAAPEQGVEASGMYKE